MDDFISIDDPFQPHVHTNESCLVWHSDGGACIRCGRCGEWIRPYNMSQRCDGKREPERVVVAHDSETITSATVAIGE